MDIREAKPDELAAVITAFSQAFDDDPVNRWIFPDAERRRAAHPLFYRAFIQGSLDAGGDLYVTDDVSAALLSMPGGAEDGDPGEFLARFDFLVDDERERFIGLMMQLGDNSSFDVPYLFPQFLGVVPERQSSGLGGAVFAHRLALLDAQGLPSFLTASTSRSPRLYERLGYRPIGTPFAPPGGATMYPMWRDPR